MRPASKTGLRKSGDGAPKRANTEVEVKLRVPDRPRFLRQLARLKAKPIRARVHEMNTLYDTADGNLARHGQMLRIRVERPARKAAGGAGARKIARGKAEKWVWLTFKGPVKEERAKDRGQYKIREEHEARIFDDGEVLGILEALGMRPWFRYEKFRSTFRLTRMKSLKLELDETPIGVFVELEGKRKEIDRAAELLGFGASDYVTQSYGALFMETHSLARGRGGASRVEPTPFSGVPDMLFRRG